MPNDRSYKDSEDRARFVMNVVRAAEVARDDFLPRWQESWINYMVQPSANLTLRGNTADPLARGFNNVGSRNSLTGGQFLKDPKSHEVVETLLAETLTKLFPDDGYIKARATGGEDWTMASGTNKIIEHVLGDDRHRRILYQWLKDAFVTGTGVAFGDWEFEEDFELERTVIERGEFSISEFQRVFKTIKDDVRLENLDLTEFYPVPGADNFQDLTGAARRIETTGPDLLDECEGSGPADGWDKQALRDAVERGYQDPDTSPESFRESLDRDDGDDPMPEFDPVAGFEYWGKVPWAGTKDDPIEGGSQRRRLLVINGDLVREQDWPLKGHRLPFFDITINPISGRLYGLSPLEVIRYDQDFADVLKQMLAMAVVKSVNPPHIVNNQQNVAIQKLKAFRSDVPVTVDGDVRTAVAQAQYNPPIEQAMAIYSNLVSPQMDVAAGAQGGVTGEGLGSKRFSASEAQTTFQAQFARPNMIALLIEGSSLPPLGKHILQQYALNVEDNRTLRDRFGDDFELTLQDLQSDWNVRFVGGRREHDRLSKAASMERFLNVVAQIPEIRAQVPWGEFLKIYAKAIDLQDLVSMIGQNEVLAENAQMQQVLGQFEGGNSAGGGLTKQKASPAETRGGVQ